MDFSVLDAQDVIVLDDQTVLKVLHAHVRAKFISGFCLCAHFSLFDDLEKYFSQTCMARQRDTPQVTSIQLPSIESMPCHLQKCLDKLWTSLDMYEYINQLFHVYRQCPYQN